MITEWGVRSDPGALLVFALLPQARPATSRMIAPARLPFRNDNNGRA
jgi:hypothetical protein